MGGIAPNFEVFRISLGSIRVRRCAPGVGGRARSEAVGRRCERLKSAMTRHWQLRNRCHSAVTHGADGR